MRIDAEALAGQLGNPLAPVWCVSGDEPLLVQEAADLIRGAARAQGFTERELFHAEAAFDWEAVAGEARAPSLFAARRILEVRAESLRALERGSDFLADHCASPPEDLLLLLVVPRLDAKARRSRWLRAVDQAGAWVEVRSVKPHQLPRWIAGRLRAAGLRASEAAVAVLAERVEGNLLAAAQEVEKLRLLAPEGELDARTLSAVVADSARHDVFALADRVLAGDAAAAGRTLRGLREEGAEPLLVLWSLARDLRVLLEAAEARRARRGVEDVFRRHRVWDSRIPLFQAALRRSAPKDLARLLQLAALVDRTAKGLAEVDPWEALSALVLALAGAPPLGEDALGTLLAG
ncbi:MAG: DNA polymerase III subunit delta [Porticoccaceae bacterium]|nr:MAG: DNA polymerase III subunit delta [Porticoccaceae bacterium]